MIAFLDRPARAAAAALLVLASGCGLSRKPLPGPFTRDNIADLADPQDGAQARAQTLYHWFNKDRDPRLTPPAWVDAQMPALSREAYQDPDDGALTEAQLWQAPFAVLYEFFEITRKTYPLQYGGFLVKPLSLTAAYRDNDERMKLAVGRLRSLHLEGSLGGRGRDSIDRLEAISIEIDGLAGSLAAKDDSRYRDSALAVATDTHDLYRALQDSAP